MQEPTAEQLTRAAQRVREMHRRATACAGDKEPLPAQPIIQSSKKSGDSFARSKSLLNMFNFKNFELDSDTSLLLGILFLISGEKTDEALILALIYIML